MVCKDGLFAIYTGDSDIFRNASYCDGNFTVDGMEKGETYTGSDGNTLTFLSDTESVQTPCGTFDSCQLWVTKVKENVYRTYFKAGIGIVKQEIVLNDVKDVRLLKSYRIAGGTGIIPFAVGNSWEYTSEDNPKFMNVQNKFTIQYADNKTVILSGNTEMERIKYDENSWLDMILQIRNEYFCEIDGHEKICDVYNAIERAQVLAKTPLEKAHTKAACSVVRRILETDPEFNPNYTATGHWNFFNKYIPKENGSKIAYTAPFYWSFEWKNYINDNAFYPLLYNDVYEIFADAAGCLWSDEWAAGNEYTIEYDSIYSTLKTKLNFENAGSITTKAGTFENCLKCSLDISGYGYGLEYRGGKKEYYFAPGIGIVRTVNYYCNDSCKAIYELTAYEGTGEGYMPIADGLMRRYDALDLTDGYVASVEYTYCADDSGHIVIFSDQCGIREKQ